MNEKTGDFAMNLNKSENSPMTPKKVWTEPIVTVIDLHSARHGNPSPISDSGANSKS
jgi:hypothetical protein